jgi:hypothetical protein
LERANSLHNCAKFGFLKEKLTSLFDLFYMFGIWLCNCINDESKPPIELKYDVVKYVDLKPNIDQLEVAVPLCLT